MCVLPVGSELADDAQYVHHSFQLQLPTAYCGGDKAARSANPSTASKGAWEMELFKNILVVAEKPVYLCYKN